MINYKSPSYLKILFTGLVPLILVGLIGYNLAPTHEEQIAAMLGGVPNYSIYDSSSFMACLTLLLFLTLRTFIMMNQIMVARGDWLREDRIAGTFKNMEVTSVGAMGIAGAFVLFAGLTHDELWLRGFWSVVAILMLSPALRRVKQFLTVTPEDEESLQKFKYNKRSLLSICGAVLALIGALANSRDLLPEIFPTAAFILLAMYFVMKLVPAIVNWEIEEEYGPDAEGEDGWKFDSSRAGFLFKGVLQVIAVIVSLILMNFHSDQTAPVWGVMIGVFTILAIYNLKQVKNIGDSSAT